MSQPAERSLDESIEAEASRGLRRAILTIAALLAGAVVVASIVIVAWPSGQSVSVGPTEPPPDQSEPVIGFDFSDVVSLGVRSDGVVVEILVPACVQTEVERISIVALDLGSTYWEVVAEPPAVLDGEVVRVGVVPSGFVEMVPLTVDPMELMFLAVVSTVDDLAIGVVGNTSLDPEVDEDSQC